MTTLPRIARFKLSVCSVTGDPGCMDCVEGQCAGSRDKAWVWANRCTGCDADDAFGELHHEESCPHYTTTHAQPATRAEG